MLDALLPLALFMFVASITPGPNNIMLAAAGASAGFRATVPHMLGISIGHAFQVALTGAAAGLVIRASAEAGPVMRVAAAAYLVWLGVRMVRAPAAEGADGGGAGRPLSFLGAAAFQWINPKAWMMALTVSGAMLPAGVPLEAALAMAAGTSVLVNLPCVACWAAAGAAIRRWLTSELRRRGFNIAMGGMLIATAAWVLTA